MCICPSRTQLQTHHFPAVIYVSQISTVFVPLFKVVAIQEVEKIFLYFIFIFPEHSMNTLADFIISFPTQQKTNTHFLFLFFEKTSGGELTTLFFMTGSGLLRLFHKFKPEQCGHIVTLRTLPKLLIIYKGFSILVDWDVLKQQVV